MTEPIAYLDGEYVPISQAKVSVFDLGLVLGASVTEMIRTFNQTPFRLQDHLQRLLKSLKAVGFSHNLTIETLTEIGQHVVEHNAALIPAHHDLGLVMFATAGQNLTYVGAAGLERSQVATVCVHTFPLPFELWADKIENGQHLITPSIRHIAADSVDPRIKNRSRMHWYLADRQAKLVAADAGALLLDHEGNVTETSTGNFFIVSDGVIITPGGGHALGGVSQMTVVELAQQLGMPYREMVVHPYDVINADEAFTSSTPYCLMPVTKLNGSEIGSGKPGPVFGRLMSAWGDRVGIDILDQIRRVAADRTA